MTESKLIVCVNAQARFFSGGTTYGNVFITDSSWVSESVLEHEDVHATQWAKLGDSFLGTYFSFQVSAELEFFWRSVLNMNGNCKYAGCYISFEIQADLLKGNYLK